MTTAIGFPRIGDPQQRGRGLLVTIDGEAVAVHDGETVAGALFALGRAAGRTTPDRRQQRGYYCGMGVCWDCALTIDGRANIRACVTRVRDGMVIETQYGFGAEPRHG